MLNKIFTRLIVFVIFILQQHLTDAQMRQVYVDIQHPDNQIKKLSFYSPSSGFVAFTDWIGFSSDSGHTFSKKYITISNVDFSGYSVNLTFGFGISGVKAFNKDTVIAYGDYGAVPAILYSIDGANTFKLIFLSQVGTLRLGNGIQDMIFPDNNKIGYAVDADRVLKSTDRGLTWNVIRTDANSYLNYLVATDDNNVFAFSQNYQVSKLIKTADAGNTWQQVTIPAFTDSKIEYADFISPSKGWINIYDGGATQRLYYTQDGGSDWKQQSDDDATPFLCGEMKFINDSTGFAIRDFFDTYKTTDSGKIWEPLPRDNNFTHLYYSHNDIQILNAVQLWAGGGNGFLELNTNIGGATLPKAYFKINILPSNSVNLINYSKTGYQYKWLVNHVFLSNNYNTSYNHNNINVVDTIQLIVTKGTKSDTLVKYGYFNNPPPPPVPSITSFTPITGNPGTVISITGINFTGATAVYIGGTPASSFNVVSASNINVTVGTGSSGTITVVTPYGTASQPGFIFRTILKITSFSPSSGPAGTTVTINGSNFSEIPSNNIVYFGAVEASVLSATNTQLTVSVPPGATYLPISVTVNGLTAYSTIPFDLTFAGGGTITKNTFPAKVDFLIDTASLYLANADFDGDSKPDIVTGNFSYLNRVTLLKNNSTQNSISFDPAEMIQLVRGYNTVWGPVATMDATGDGKQDIIAGNGNNLSYLKNESVTGDMKFASPVTIGGIITEYVMIADFDADGRPDILCPGPNTPGIRIFQNATTGGNFSIKDGYTIVYGSYNSNNRLGDVIAGDFNGDGKPDVVTMEYYGNWTIDVYKNTSNAGIISFVQQPLALTDPFPRTQFYDLATGDFDGDGKLDLAATLNNGYIAIYRNTTANGVISFAAAVTFPMNHDESAIAVGDLNGDGKPDLAMADFNYESDTSNDIQAVVLENKSTPGNILFGPNVDFSYTSANHASKKLCIADFNGDGIPEIAIENSGTDSLSILLRKENALPIILIDFSGHLENDNSILVWQTASENNTNHFEVQRSNDGTNFSDIGSVKAAGNSTLVKSYTYIDQAISQFKSNQLYYRLEEIDNDGKIQFSNVVSIKVDASQNEIRVYPNPAHNFINIDLKKQLSKNSSIILYNMSGKKIMEQKISAATLHQQLNVSGLSKGSYRISVLDNSGEQFNRFVILGY